MPKKLLEEIKKIKNHPILEKKFNINEIINESSSFLNVTIPIFSNKIPEFNEEIFNIFPR